MKNDDLKPCPFCGSNDVHIREVKKFGSFITCYKCLISFFQEEAVCVEDNIEAWNRRVTDG